MKGWIGAVFMLMAASSALGEAHFVFDLGDLSDLQYSMNLGQDSGAAFRVFGDIPAEIREDVLSHLAADDFGALSDLLLAEKVAPNALDVIFAEAISQERVGCIAGLIEMGADVMMQDFQGQTPLHYAAFRGNTEVMEVLLEQKAQVDAWDGMRMRTPLMIAVAKGQTACVDRLIAAGANVNIEGADGITPLMMCAEKDFALNALIEAGAEINRASKRTGDTPLLLAVRCNAKQMVKTLLEKGADVTVANRSGETVLSIALEKEAYALFDELCAKGATLQDDALNKVLAAGSPTLIDFLKERQLLPKDVWPALRCAIQNAPEGAANTSMVLPLWNLIPVEQRDVAALQAFWLQKGAPRDNIVTAIETCARTAGEFKPLVWKVVDLDFTDSERAFSRFRVLKGRRANLMVRNEKGWTLLDKLALDKSVPGFGTARYDRVVKRIAQIYAEERLNSILTNWVKPITDVSKVSVVGKIDPILTLHVPAKGPAALEIRLKNPSTTGNLSMSVKALTLQVGENEQLVLPPFELVAAPLQEAYAHFRLDGGEGNEDGDAVLTTLNFPKGTHLEWSSGGYGKQVAYSQEELPPLEIFYKRGCKAVEIEAADVMEWGAK